MRRKREMRRLEANPACARRQLAHARADRSHQILVRLRHRDELAQRLDALEVAEVGQEHRSARVREHGAVAAGVAGQVAHVGQVGDEQRIHLVGGEPGREPFQACRVVHGRRSAR